MELNNNFNRQRKRNERYIHKLEQKISDNQIGYRWINVVPGFEMPLKVIIDGIEQFIKPTSMWKKIPGNQLAIDRNFYVK